ncbi:MAG: response regulator transcription factor [Desulfarculaceae bacterium]|nr:response regulator transcription factor [Desulfarculaceae bacterium]MCF8048246.1 response regulator transcription factor [Desulfarculaceae bacterium]MCF8064289.1 response regulator transcription factor [Desulfarculaceae bacterium]MCF8096528.1 response regulator transcription factor [Desulfarculaceae bacterium]MCF8121782.1 response regulator transcription factor [Desulfarculaceae bacterium]
MVPIRVLIVDDHSIVREGLKALLELEPDICVVDESNNAMDAMRKAEQCSPDLVLMDLKMPGLSGIEACRLIKKNSPHIKVVLLTNYEDKEFVHEALNAQADGYVLKNVKKGDLAMIIKTTMQGGAYLDPMVTRKALDRLAACSDDDSPPADQPKLTQRELQILLEVVSGASNKEIAQHINLSLDTVKSHLKNIYGKLGVRSRSQAIKVALELKLISMPM